MWPFRPRFVELLSLLGTETSLEGLWVFPFTIATGEFVALQDLSVSEDTSEGVAFASYHTGEVDVLFIVAFGESIRADFPCSANPDR